MTQTEALQILKMGNNVFLTGSAGSGKTYVLNAYINHLRQHGVNVAVTASTGIAATHMQGVTIHAWSGIGIKTAMTDRDIDQLEQKRHVYQRFEKARVLIIDEVSMLSAEFLDLLDRVCRSMKRNNAPFGGLQIVLCGDLFQLPPVTRDGQAHLINESQAWSTMNLVVCYLSEQHRQDDDDFVGILNAIRDGVVDEYHEDLLNARMCTDPSIHECVTTLFTHNVDVDAINNQRLAALSGEEFRYVMQEKGSDALVAALKKGCLAAETLLLKHGTEVMFIKNNPEFGYVNGTRGTVIDFTMEREPIVETLTGERITVVPAEWAIEEDGKIKAVITQLPLRHAWAITVHKSQGMSLDEALIDLSKAFVSGMGYVALSRVRRLSGVHLLGIHTGAFAIDPRVRVIDTQLRAASDRASVSLQRLTAGEQQTLIEYFIQRSGGYLDAVPVAKKTRAKKQPTHLISYQLVKGGLTLGQAAQERSLTVGTILSHLERCKDAGMFVAFPHLALKPIQMKQIQQAFKKTRSYELTPIKKELEQSGNSYSFEDIRIGRLFIDSNT